MVTPEGAKDHSSPLGMSLHEMMSQHPCGFVSGPVGGASARVREAPRACARAGVLRGACNERGVSQRAKEWGVF